VPSRNLQVLLDDFAPGCGVADLSQVHGATVARAERAVDIAVDDVRPRADGIVTDRPDLVLLVRAADCVPLLLADPGAGVVGAAHAGRRGLEVGVVPATVEQMRALGAREVTAWVGPHVCGSCYEVPAAMQAEVAAAVPAARATTSWGTPSLDLGAGVRAQLAEAGATVVDVATCTLESPHLYSHRRDGDRAGRHAGVVRLRGAA
jgi:polyphenol oxidase